MTTITILLSSFLFIFTAQATNCHKEGGHSHDEITTNGVSSGEITDNIININVNGMVCDFCARGIEKTFIKDKTVKKIDVDLNQGKVLIAYEMDRKIDFEEIKAKIVMNGQNATAMKVLKI